MNFHGEKNCSSLTKETQKNAVNPEEPHQKAGKFPITFWPVIYAKWTHF